MKFSDLDFLLAAFSTKSKILDTVDDLGTLQSILINLIEFTGDCKIDGPCEECGDYIYTYNLEVDE